MVILLYKDNMSAVQPLTNGLFNGFDRDEKMPSTGNNDECYPPSSTGKEGPDQILPADEDTTWEANGRVRIKKTTNEEYPDIVSVPGLLMRISKKFPNTKAMVSRAGVDGKRQIWTYKEYERDVRTVAKAFLKLGLERYHSVGILGFNCPQWFISDMAAIWAGGFAAGIYTTNSPDACQYCAEHSRANIIVVEDNHQLEKILQIRHNLPHLKAIIQFDGIPKQKDILSWNDLLELGKSESDDRLESVLKTIGVNECCTLVYTSGTVGRPKAVMLSHDNLLVDSKMVSESVPSMNDGQESIVSYLPLSHVAAQMLEVYISLWIAATVYFADRNALKGSLVETLAYARPTAFLGVPRVWEKIHEKMMMVARSNGPIKTWIATWAKNQGLNYNMNKINGVDYKSWGYLIARFLVFNKIKSTLGLDRCKIMFTGAAPLSDEIKKYFMSLDMVIMDAFGMSETSGAHTLCLEDSYKMGSVGKHLRGYKTKLDNPNDTGEGEVCMGGRHVFMGYLSEPEKTKEAKDDSGWLHSGDLGRLDSHGFLYITGRIKELIITAGAENIPPVPIELALLKELSALSNAMVIGDRRKYLTILVTLKTHMDPDTGGPLDTLLPSTKSWAKSLGSRATTVSEIINTRDPAIHNEIEKAIIRINNLATSNAQKVQKFKILPQDFSIPTGELGPTLKLKRSFVVDKYKDIIEELYN